MVDIVLTIICIAYIAIPIVGWLLSWWIGLILTLWAITFAGIIILLEMKRLGVYQNRSP